MLTVNGWEEIRRAYHVEEKSLREIVRETGRAWRTVKKMAESDEPPRYQRQEAVAAQKLGPYKERIQELLGENKRLPRKQQWTASRIFDKFERKDTRGRSQQCATMLVKRAS